MKEDREDIVYQIALLEMMNVGPSVARKVIQHFGSAKHVFEANPNQLEELGAIGRKILSQLHDQKHLNFAKAQLQFCENSGAEVISYFSNSYPYRLKECHDAPLILYQKGHCNLNAQRMVAIVGTRDCSSYGKKFCDKLVEELSKYEVTIVSGLAYGIDACAHKSAIKNNAYNIGVVAHGLDRIYPVDHQSLSKEVIKRGALVTEFPTRTNPDRENFPKRNRIVAGMVDAVIVVESAIKGGSMITARLANDYNRDVFALPGKIGESRSEGCNYLIKNHQANLLQSVEDVIINQGWEPKETKVENGHQRLIDFDLSEQEMKIVDLLAVQSSTIDDLSNKSGILVSDLSSQLLMLELRGVVKQLPGKLYQMAK